MSRVRQFLIVLFCFFGFIPPVFSQYINVDSVIVLPGYDTPLIHDDFNSLMNELEPKDISPRQDIYYGQYIPAGKILSHFVVPADGKVISRYGMRSGRMHTGTDIKMATGDTIYSAYHGIVSRAKYY